MTQKVSSMQSLIPADQEILRQQSESLVPKRWCEFVVMLAHMRSQYSESDTDNKFRKYDEVCEKHSNAKHIANYLLACFFNKTKVDIEIINRIFKHNRGNTYRVLNKLIECGAIDRTWRPTEMLLTLNRERALAFFDNDMFRTFILGCAGYISSLNIKEMAEKTDGGFPLDIIFGEKETDENVQLYESAQATNLVRSAYLTVDQKREIDKEKV